LPIEIGQKEGGRRCFSRIKFSSILVIPQQAPVAVAEEVLRRSRPKGRKAMESFAWVEKISGELRTFGYDVMGEVIVFWTIWRSRKIRAAGPGTE
jgi:hypothetical protein